MQRDFRERKSYRWYKGLGSDYTYLERAKLHCKLQLLKCNCLVTKYKMVNKY